MREILKKLFKSKRSDALSHRYIRNKRAEKGYGAYFTVSQKFFIWLFNDEPYSWDKHK